MYGGNYVRYRTKKWADAVEEALYWQSPPPHWMMGRHYRAKNLVKKFHKNGLLPMLLEDVANDKIPKGHDKGSILKFGEWYAGEGRFRRG